MNAVLLFGVTAVIAFTPSTLASDDEEMIKSIYEKCKEETQIDESEIESFKTMELPTTDKSLCMMGCLMREAAIIIDGKFDKDGALRVAEKYYEGRADELEKARIVVDICETQTADETDECATAGKVITCITKEAEKIGLTSIPTE